MKVSTHFSILPVEPESALLAAGEKVPGLVEPRPVYARGDFVRGPAGGYLLTSLELIEPSMYLRTNKDAPERLAAAFDEHIKHLQGVSS
jgi:hypothetical protein